MTLILSSGSLHPTSHERKPNDSDYEAIYDQDTIVVIVRYCTRDMVEYMLGYARFPRRVSVIVKSRSTRALGGETREPAKCWMWGAVSCQSEVGMLPNPSLCVCMYGALLCTRDVECLTIASYDSCLDVFPYARVRFRTCLGTESASHDVARRLASSEKVQSRR